MQRPKNKCISVPGESGSEAGMTAFEKDVPDFPWRTKGKSRIFPELKQM